jgi:broad specificity polyphosphatase/5'/3'-nucleotidase SurE
VRVLLTNDDGFAAGGIGALRAALAGSCDSVITVAPATDCSGFARKCTFARPVAVTRVTGGRHPVYPARRAGAASVLTRPGRRAYPRVAMPEWAADGDVGSLYLFGEPDEIIPEADASAGTDIAALRAGYVSVTPLAPAAGISPGVRSFIARLAQAFPIAT